MKNIKATIAKTSIVLMFAPFFAFIALAILALLTALTGMVPPADNTFAAITLITTGISFFIGIISLLLANTVWWFWRLLIGLLYVPVTLAILLGSGF